MDKWHGMTMEDIRALEEKTKKELDEERGKVTLKRNKILGRSAILSNETRTLHVNIYIFIIR